MHCYDFGLIGFGTTEPPPPDGAGRPRGNACAFGIRDRSSRCVRNYNKYMRRRHSAGHGACDECLYTTWLRHRPQASAARNRSSCPFPCAGIPAAKGLARTPTTQKLTSMYEEAFAVHQEEAGDEEYPDREPSPPASPFTRNISNFQRRWSIGLPRARSDSVSSIATM